jgi:hypothetical protein
MRCAALVISIDNGISHLAHFGGVSQHLLLAPACLPASFVANPRGRMIRGVPIDITVQKVLEAAEEMLR